MLFKYKDSRWSVIPENDENVIEKVKNYYCFHKHTSIIFQKYSSTWDEWVDVKVDDICDNDKVNIIVMENPITIKHQKTVKKA